MRPWKVILAESALSDLDEVLDATLEAFGTAQLKRYAERFKNAIRELEEAGSKADCFSY